MTVKHKLRFWEAEIFSAGFSIDVKITVKWAKIFLSLFEERISLTMPSDHSISLQVS